MVSTHRRASSSSRRRSSVEAAHRSACLERRPLRRPRVPRSATARRAASQLLRRERRPLPLGVRRGSRAQLRRSRRGTRSRAGGTIAVDRGRRRRCATGVQPSRAAQTVRREPSRRCLVERGDAVVVEAGRDRCRTRAPRRARPNASRLRAICRRTSRSASSRAAPVELVDRDRVGEVEHVDLLELARRAELRRHDVERHVDERRRCRRRPGRCPGVSTITRSDPAALQAAIDVRRRRRGSSPSAIGWRATGRTHRGRSIEFIRMRSPRRAPPPLRRVGSTARTATRSLSSWSSRKPADDLVGERRLPRATGAR